MCKWYLLLVMMGKIYFSLNRSKFHLKLLVSLSLLRCGMVRPFKKQDYIGRGILLYRYKKWGMIKKEENLKIFTELYRTQNLWEKCWISVLTLRYWTMEKIWRFQKSLFVSFWILLHSEEIGFCMFPLNKDARFHYVFSSIKSNHISLILWSVWIR